MQNEAMLKFDKHAGYYFLLLFLEIFGLTEFYGLPESYSAYQENFTSWTIAGVREYWRIALWVLGALLFFIAPKYQLIHSQWKKQIQSHNQNTWLVFHLLCFIGFATFTNNFFESLNQSTQPSIYYLFGWLFLAACTFGSWLICLAPMRFWQWFLKNLWLEFLAGIALGLCAWLLMGMLIRQDAPLGQKALWLGLSNLTLEIVYKLLGWFYSGLIYNPELLVVGTEEFPIKITYACSGIEGVSLIIMFLSLYLWLFRKELRFPHVFWLYPLGILTIWLANSVRIFLLIAVGTSYSSEIASRSLHAQAGWIVFTLVSLGAIIFVHHSRLFSLKPFSRNEIHNNNRQATALLAPFLAQLAIVMVASAFSGDFDKFYPVKIFVTGAVLCYFIKFYRTLSWKWSWQALAIGTGVFAFWILLDQDSADKGNELVKGLDGLSDFSAMIWIVFRMAGSSFVIPIAEELAFRGYLMRKLVANDFENVPFGQYTLLSFLISSLLFGFLHGRWFAGLLAGMCYALALYRNKQLGDAIIAHMTTNFLIAMYVLIFHKWSLWA